jgi:hypothetical protein
VSETVFESSSTPATTKDGFDIALPESEESPIRAADLVERACDPNDVGAPLKITGDQTIRTADELHKVLAKHLDRCVDVVVDLSEVDAGWSDLGVDAKFAVLKQGQILPGISLMPSISMPAGNRAFTSSTYDRCLAVAWLKTLPAGLSLGGRFTGTRISDEQVRHARYKSATSLGFPAPARSAGYVEIYSVGSVGQGGESTWVADAGTSRQFGAKLQMDIEVGAGYPPERLAGSSQRDLRFDTHRYSDVDGDGGADPSGSRLGGTL